MIEKKRLYITYSYFKFYQALIMAYEKKGLEDSEIVLLKSPNDKTNYEWLLDYLNIDFIKIKIIEVKKYFSIKDYFPLYKYLLKNKEKFLLDKIFIPREFDARLHLFVQIFITKNIESLGDGAGLIWDDSTPDSLKTKLKYFPFKMLFNVKLPYELSKTRDRNFFRKKWKFFSKYDLPVKNECWIFGTSIPFVKPYSLDYYSPLSREFYEKGGWKSKEYIRWMENLVNMLNKNNIPHRYYPHPLEPKNEFKNVKFYSKNTYAEFLPFELGYLPKYIFALSTTAFSYLSILNTLNKDIDLYVLHQTEKIDEIYKEYGAKIYYPNSELKFKKE